MELLLSSLPGPLNARRGPDTSVSAPDLKGQRRTFQPEFCKEWSGGGGQLTSPMLQALFLEANRQTRLQLATLFRSVVSAPMPMWHFSPRASRLPTKGSHDWVRLIRKKAFRLEGLSG